MCSPAAGKVLNPIAAIAPDKGPLSTLSPSKIIGRQMGDTQLRDVLDPAGSLREGGYYNRAVQKERQEINNRRPSKTTSSTTSLSPKEEL